LPIPVAAAIFALSACGNSGSSTTASTTAPTTPTASVQDAVATATPIKHLVVIFSENESFDHYFGTYPTAVNAEGEPAFTALPNTPSVNNLLNNGLITTNPNALPTSPNAMGKTVNGVTYAGTGLTAANLVPFRLDRSQAATVSMNHSYTPEQLAYDNGAMDAFPLFTGAAGSGSTGEFGTKGLVLGYYDGNTVTALWNYAQHFAMNQNAYTDTYGPSTPGALEVVSGQNNGATISNGTTTSAINDGAGSMTLVGDADPTGDVCSSGATATMKGQNIGDLLNAKGLTWGGFMGGFNLGLTNANGTTNCQRSTYSSVLMTTKADYVQHHNWFQYYTTTANPQHTRPSGTQYIGMTDPLDNTATPVHHEYDINDFYAAVSAGKFPSVSFLKAPAIEDGHPGNSDPLDEQTFFTNVINFLQQQPDWKNTAVIIAYDDSDGWYDHAYKAPTSSSFDSTSQQTINGQTLTGYDQLNGPGQCTATGAVQPQGVSGGLINGRCGPGTRTPFIVVSPYAKANFVDSTPITQASVVKFIEDNWLGGQRIGGGSFDANAGSIMNLFDFSATGGNNPPLYLDPNQGTVLSAPPAGSTSPSSM
jgi:phospholipase C